MKSRNWFLTGLLLLLGAALLLREGERRRAREQVVAGTNAAPPAAGVWERFTRLPAVLTGRRPAAAPAPVASTAHVKALSDDPRLPFRVRNTATPDAELFRSETAVLLRNALVETREPVRLNIPPHLRAQADPGSWLVQARGSIDGKFREVLRGAGAEVVSYVPNNTYLVRASAAVAQQLRVAPRVHSVLPFEPFYKLDMQLLPLAVRQEALPAGRWLNLVVFHGAQERARADLAALGAEVKAEQPFPFGHVLTIAPRADSLVALAQLSAVQNIEAYHSPVLMNDLSRVRLDVSTNTTDAAPGGNWLGLTGAGVFLGHVDSGLDLAHPQLAGRFFVNAFSPAADADGHGTAVGGVIVGTDSTTPTATNGSLAGSTYRGIAPGARLYPLSIYAIDYTNYGNIWLITNAALATNIFIVNNSWGYPVSTYDINSALYDEKVRDSLDWMTNVQPQTHVFAAGNAGNANSGGLGGAADTIASPGNAKNVITVGSHELFRLVRNTTNDPQANARSDSFSQVSDFSSRGNVGVGIEGTAGRFKPDFVAPGQYIATLRASTFTNPQPADADLGSSLWRYESGTSLAAGKVAGVLALVEEFFRANFGRTNGLRPSLNKALLINRAQSLGPAYDFSVNSPVTHQGWGVPSLSNTLPSVAGIAFLSAAASATAPIVLVEENAFRTNHVASGEYHAFDVSVPAIPGGTNNLKITLAWTDPPGNPISSVKLVNDLDLYVTNTGVVNGDQYEGNNIAPGGIVSQPTSVGSISQRDSVNNVENTFIPLTNTSGTASFRVYVIGRKVNVNAVSGNTNQVAQDYSLVISTDNPATAVTVTVPATAIFYAYTNRALNIVTNGVPYLNERVGANSPLYTLNGTANANTNGVTNQWNFYVYTNLNYPNASVTNLATNITAGVTNVMTNVVQLPRISGGPYVAFSTFLPPNLAKARNGDADIDLFVARDGGPAPVPNAFNLTNLDPAVLSHPNTIRSTNRGGYELFNVTNSAIGEIFYVGIKSEDQQGGAYGFFGASSPFPFFSTNTNGYFQVALFPVPMDIPDGTPENPGGVTLYGILPTNVLMQSITMSNIIVHENLGDLVGTLTHNGTVVTLNNHSVAVGGGTNPPGGLVTHNLVYDSFRNPPDGPGDVTDFLGQDGVGLWIFELYDNTPFQTGAVTYADLYLVPYTNQYTTNPNVFYRTFDLAAGQSFVDFFNIPSFATNLDVDIVGGLAGVPGPASSNGVDILASAPGGGVPTSQNYGMAAFDLDNLDATTYPHLRISPISTPPITPGLWNFRVLNNSASQLTLTLRYTLGVNLAVTDTSFNYTNVGISLLDEYTTNLYFNVSSDRVVSSVDVGVAIRHPRVSDLVLHLISPSGRKALLFENRGGTNGVTTTDLRANFSENTNYVTHVDTNGSAAGGFFNLGRLQPIKFIPAPYSAVVSPPSLVTNMTNLLFGHGAFANSPYESPGGLAHFGQQLVMAGKVARGGNPDIPTTRTNDGFVAAYQTPIVTNQYSTNIFTNFNGGLAVTIGTNFIPVTNWTVTNFWPGSLSGYRGGNPAIGSPVPEQTFFSGVALNVDGVFAVGQTRNYFPPTALTWSGTNTRQVYDVDLGSTAGSVNLAHLSDTVRDRILVEYQGLPLMDFTPAAGAAPTNFVTNLLYHGSSRFLRVTVNPVVNAAAGSTWTNTLTIFRSNGVTFAVNNLVSNTFNVVPPTTAPSPNTNRNPQGVAIDDRNNIYVADTDNNRIVKFTQVVPFPAPGGNSLNPNYVPLTLAAAVPALFANFNAPAGVAVATNGDIYVADTGNNLIKRYSSNGTFLQVWGDTSVAPPANAGSNDTPSFAAGRFSGPQGICIAADGTVFIADTGNNLIRTIDVNGAVGRIPLPAGFIAANGDLNGPRGVVATVGSPGPWDNSLSNRLGAGLGYGFNSATNVYVADTLNNRVVWLSWSNTMWTANHLAGRLFPAFTPGRVDNTNTLASFNAPSGITRDGYGNLYVTDAGSHLIRRVTPLGDVQTIAGDSAGGTSGNVNNDVGGTARFNTPRGLVADRFGTLFVADSGNHSIRVVAPYQTGTPTNAFVAYFPFNGPTNSHIMGADPVFFSRGITSSVFGVELAGSSPASRDVFNGVASATEYGIAGQATNFLYAVGSAQFSTNTVTGQSAYDRMFLTKFGTNGQPVWTRGHLPAAAIRAVTNGLGAITGLVIDSGGAGYTAVPVATIHDPLNPVAANRNIAVTVGLTGGSVTSISSPATPLTGPFVAPRVYVEAPPSPQMPGHAVAVMHGTNVVAAGYTNVSAVVSTTNNQPFLLCLETTNGTLRWATNSLTSGHYNAVAVYGTNLIAAGAAYSSATPSGVAGSNCLIESWTLAGTPLLSTIHNFGGGRPSQLSGLIAIEQLDRAYAVGTVSNNATSCDAFLMEIDLQTLAVISVVTNNITNGLNFGKAITTDGVDLYVAVEGPGDGNASDRQAAIFRYRAKNFYQPEESLNVFAGDRTWGTRTYYDPMTGIGAPVTDTAWRLQITDTRAGGTNVGGTNGMVLSWSLNFSYAAPNTVPITLLGGLTNTPITLATGPKYFRVPVPSAATAATNRITATGPVRVSFHASGMPADGAPGTRQMFSAASTGSFVVSTNTNAVARLRPGSEYYLAITPMAAGAPVEVSVEVNFDRTELPPQILALTGGVPLDGLALANGSVKHYSFAVPAGASAALFEIAAANGDVNLYLRRSNGPASLPGPGGFDHASANPFVGTEQIFLVTNTASTAALTPGTWLLGVNNAGNAPVNFTVRATAASATPYTVVTSANGQTHAGVTSPGNAPNTLYKLTVPAGEKALLFELTGLNGNGDLVVRRNAFPLATAFDFGNPRPGGAPEWITLRTNASLPSLAGDWYFGVLNPGATHLTYNVMARQSVNGVLLGSAPLQIGRPPGSSMLTGGTGFGFGLNGVPGERYQVQYRTNIAATNWVVLTNLTAPADGVISFIHAGALTNKNLYYRFLAVP